MTSDFKEILKIFLLSFLIFFFLLLRLFPIFILIEDSEDYWYPGVYNRESAHRHTLTHNIHLTATSTASSTESPSPAQGPGQQRDSLCAFWCHHHHSSSTFMANQDGLEHKNDPSLTLSK